MNRKTKPPCHEVRAWVKHRIGRDCFAPFTGQDAPAFAAWAHLIELYLHSDYAGRAHALRAMRHVLEAMQPSCWPVAKAAIPAIGDWSHEDEIWNALFTKEERLVLLKGGRA